MGEASDLWSGRSRRKLPQGIEDIGAAQRSRRDRIQVECGGKVRRLLPEGDAQKLSLGAAQQARYHRAYLLLPVLTRSQYEGRGMLEFPSRRFGRQVFTSSGKEPIALEFQGERGGPVEISLERQRLLDASHFR